jgi:hypothetical protein
VNTLIADPPPGAPAPPILPTDRFLFLDRDKFHASFAGDLTRRSRGAWTRSADRSPNAPGGPSRAGTCWPPKTG